ncbi:MAG TPA: hypothetical protein VJA00_03395, partial [Candidatus Omnitrophota bacterium]|nr:hypothetical protein [Candidatus Omnitrophota bacterium]
KTSFPSGRFSKDSIMLAEWPKPVFEGRFEKEATEVRLFQEAVAGVRDLRTRLGLKPAEKLEVVHIIIKNSDMRGYLHNNKDFKSIIFNLCHVNSIEIATEGQKGSGMVGRVYPNMEIFITGLNPETLKAEEGRTKKKITELESVIHSLEGRLSDSQFISNAPEDVIEKEKERKEELRKQLEAYRENLALFSQN